MGSKSYSQLSYEKRDKETGEEPDDIELWEASHLKNGEWSNNQSQAVHNEAYTQVTEKEAKQGGPISNEERNKKFQNTYRSSLGCGASKVPGRGYMANPCNVSERLRTQMDENARATVETRRQNEELNYHVRNLEDRNEELSLHVHDLEEKNTLLNVQVQSLGDKNDELNIHMKNLEDQLAVDRAQRAKKMEVLKQSMREEVLKLVGNQQAAMQHVTHSSQQKNPERSSSGSNIKCTTLPENVPAARIISSQQLRRTANLYRRSRVDMDKT